MRDSVQALRTLSRGTVALLVLVNSIVFLAVGPAAASPDLVPGSTGNEPTNASVNPRNPAQVAVMQGCTVLISNDFGQTFPVVRGTTVAGCSGDPVIAFDSQGNMFVTHLTRSFDPANSLQVAVGQVTDTTTSGNGTYTPVQVSTIDGNNHDKQWLVADANPVSPYRDNLYIVWTSFSSPSRIMFSRSTDSGQNWTPQQVISADGEGFVWPSHLAVGPNGDLYISYHTDTCNQNGLSGTMPLIRDGSGGTKLAADGVPFEIEQKTNAFGLGQGSISCNVQDGSGDELPQTDFWLQGSMQPWVLPDPARAGNVYVVASDDPNEVYGGSPLGGDNANVVIARSTDNGATFTRSRVDHGPGQTFAVLPNAAIDQDGNIVVTWYDNRSGFTNGGTGGDFNDNFLLELYGTTSRDGGATWVQDFRISDAWFDPDLNAVCRFGPDANCGTVGNAQRTLRIGEYNGIWTANGIGYTTWTGNATPAVPPAGAAGAQTTYFDLFSMLGAFPDSFEPNESGSAAVVANLGTDDRFNANRLTLHTATDIDFFKVTPLHSGYLEIDVDFNEVVADLLVQAVDKFGNLVGTGALETLQAGSSTRAVALPVVKGEPYFVSVEVEDAVNSAPPQTTYDLRVVNRAAPEPFGIDLATETDSGRFDNDDVTNLTTPTIRLRLDDDDMLDAGIQFSPDNGTATLLDDAPGYKVEVLANGSLSGYASPIAGQPGMYQLAIPASGALTEGENLISAAVKIVDPSDDPNVPGTAHLVGKGSDSAHSLGVRLDTIAPPIPDAPDLLASSDNAGVNIDNITTLLSPAFKGTAESKTLVRVLASGDVVGEAVTTPAGAYEIVTEPLADAVYDVAVEAEDLAGNVSSASAALPVTIANQSLSLAGAIADVTVDLTSDTVAGYPGIPGGLAGIRGIPQVNLDAAGNGLEVVGTHDDDSILYTPTGADGGRVTRADSPQVLRLSWVLGQFTIDPGAGDDQVGVQGTINPDTITGSVAAVTALQVNSMKTVHIPDATAERIGVTGRQGQDSIEFTVFDDVSAFLFVDSGEPTAIKTVADTLTVKAGSEKAKLQNAPGGGGGNGEEGSVFVSYPQTTGIETRIDYINTEKIKLVK